MLRLVALLLLSLPLLGQADARNVQQGSPIPAGGYSAPPRVVQLPDDTWLAVLTTGKGPAGDRGRHIVSRRSPDRGQSWEGGIDIEPAGERPSLWAQPLLLPSGRVVVFYLQGDLAAAKERISRSGDLALRYSDDGGRSWSERILLPLPETVLAREQDPGGDVDGLLGTGRPLFTAGSVLLPFSRIGSSPDERTEVWVLRSEDLASLDDPAAAHWQLFPAGEKGLHGAGPITTDPCLAPLPGRGVACAMATTLGYPLLALSPDGGRTWSAPRPLRDRRGRPIRHPRDSVGLWRFGPDRYLLWTREDSTPTAESGRCNPAWIRGARLVGGELRFGPPEILLYDPDPHTAPSDPDLVLGRDGSVSVVVSRGSVLQTHPIAPSLLTQLFTTSPAEGPRREELPGFVAQGAGGTSLAAAGKLRGGWTCEAWLPAQAEPPFIVAQAQDGAGSMALFLDSDGSLGLTLADGDQEVTVRSQPQALSAGKPHHLAVIVDLGPGIVRWIVDGQVLDGGESLARGWSRIETRSRPARDEKLLVTDPAQASILIENGDRYHLAVQAPRNGLLVPIGRAQELRAPYGRVRQVGFISTGVGFQASSDPGVPSDGHVRLHYADGFSQDFIWNLRDSDGSGRGTAVGLVPEVWTLVRTDGSEQWPGRRLYWQSFPADADRELVAIEFDARPAQDADGNDAEFAVLAVSETPSFSPLDAPLVPIELDADSWNADLFAASATDNAGRGFRRIPLRPAVAMQAIEVLTRAPLVVGDAPLRAVHYGRALLAAEILALER